jgi:pimeloyl-ACP methyl ester carboxylesterase
MCAELHIIKVPALIVCGEQDQLTPMVKSEALKQGIKGAELYPIPDAGHLSNLEQPIYFNQGLKAFIDKSSMVSVV